MQPTDYIPEIRNRLATAKEFIDDFKLKSDIFFNSKPYTIVTEEEVHGDSKIVRNRFIVRREIPDGLRVPVRMSLTELRDILDNLVWGLAQVVGEPYSCEIAFPVYQMEFPPRSNPGARSFEGWIKRNQRILSKFPAGAQPLITQLQPFNAYKENQVGSHHPIFILNKLVNDKKHKIALQITGVHSYGVHAGHLKLTGPAHIGPGQPLQHNSVITEVTVPVSDLSPNFEIKVATYIAFDKNGPLLGAPVYEFLIYMHSFIRDEIVTKFETFFPK